MYITSHACKTCRPQRHVRVYSDDILLLFALQGFFYFFYSVIHRIILLPHSVLGRTRNSLFFFAFFFFLSRRHFVAKKEEKASARPRKCNKPIIPVFRLSRTGNRLQFEGRLVRRHRRHRPAPAKSVYRQRLLTKKRRTVKLLAKFDFPSSDLNAILFSTLSLYARTYTYE